MVPGVSPLWSPPEVIGSYTPSATLSMEGVKGTENGPVSAMAPLIVVVLFAVGASGLDLTVLHTNDMHARLEPIGIGGGSCIPGRRCYGGFARIKSFANRIRSSTRNVLFLNAGDNYQGTPYYSMFKWRVIAPFIDKLGIDAMSLGNHEFDDGIDGLLPYLRNTSTPTVCCNIDASDTFYRTNLHPWKMFKLDNTTIAVLGYLTPDTRWLAKTGDIKIFDEVVALQRAVHEVRQDGANIVIALGHSGWETDLRIAYNVDGLDLVIGGHTNTFLYSGKPPDREVPASTYPHIVKSRTGRRVPVVQAYAYTKYVGVLRLRFDIYPTTRLISAEGNPVLMDESIPEDVGVRRMLDTWKSQLSEKVKAKVGETLVDLDGDCRMKECNFGNLISDSYIRQAAKLFNHRDTGRWTDTPVALLNGGSVRTSILYNETGGILTQNEGLTALPFNNNLVKVRLTGHQLKEILEHSVDKYDIKGIEQQGGFLQVSGLKIVYDVRRPVGDRVVSAQVRCSICSIPEYHYLYGDDVLSVVTSQFLTDGGDGYSIFLRDSIPKESLGVSDYTAFTEYLKEVSPVLPEVEGRIRVIRTDADSSASSMALSRYFISIVPFLFMRR